MSPRVRRLVPLVALALVTAVAGVAGPARATPLLTCEGEVATIVGTDGPDVIRGTDGDDVIVARGGNDVVDGRGGRDVVCGGDGNDVLLGGSGDDVLRGQAGNDVVRGGTGLDVCTAEVAACEQMTVFPVLAEFPVPGLVSGSGGPLLVTVTNPTATPTDVTLLVTLSPGLTSTQSVSPDPWSCRSGDGGRVQQCTLTGLTGTTWIRLDVGTSLPAGSTGSALACLSLGDTPVPTPGCVTARTTVVSP